MTRAVVQRFIDETDLAGSTLCLHTSLRRHTPPLDADEMIDTLLDADITLMVPAFSYFFETPPPPTGGPERNGMAGAAGAMPGSTQAVMFDASRNALSTADMGQFVAAILRRQQRRRGQHPLNSMAALGPHADRLISLQSTEDVYAPLRELVALKGQLLMAGTDLRSLTFIHYAEQLSGRELFIRWANWQGDPHHPVRVGSCSNGFNALWPELRAVTRTHTVNQAAWHLLDAGAALARLRTFLSDNPAATHCHSRDCQRCPDAVAGGPLLSRLE